MENFSSEKGYLLATFYAKFCHILKEPILLTLDLSKKWGAKVGSVKENRVY